MEVPRQAVSWMPINRSGSATVATEVWTFQLEDGTHRVELEHGYWSGKRRVLIDGVPREETAKVVHALMDQGSDHTFEFNEHTITICIRTNGLTFSYDLVLDGTSVRTGRPVVNPGTTPTWAWVFMVACGIIPVLTLGGAVPTAIGVGGAAGCRKIARGASHSGVRIGLCLLVTVACWLVVVALVVTTYLYRTPA